jgi:hypothetical protein
MHEHSSRPNAHAHTYYESRALIKLEQGVARQRPRFLPPLPRKPRNAATGCSTGVASLHTVPGRDMNLNSDSESEDRVEVEVAATLELHEGEDENEGKEEDEDDEGLGQTEAAAARLKAEAEGLTLLPSSNIKAGYRHVYDVGGSRPFGASVRRAGKQVAFIGLVVHKQFEGTARSPAHSETSRTPQATLY